MTRIAQTRGRRTPVLWVQSADGASHGGLLADFVLDEIGAWAHQQRRTSRAATQRALREVRSADRNAQVADDESDDSPQAATDSITAIPWEPHRRSRAITPPAECRTTQQNAVTTIGHLNIRTQTVTSARCQTSDDDGGPAEEKRTHVDGRRPNGRSEPSGLLVRRSRSA